jgi:CSLREA domain-containing protein
MQAQKRTRKASRFAALLVGAVSLGLGLTTTASAASIQVNTLLDGSVAGACTLRDAIAAANTDTAVNGCPAGSLGANTITFTVSGTITLGRVPPEVISGSTITVDGSGQSITVSGNNAWNVFVNSGTLQLRNPTVSNGGVNSGSGAFNRGTLSVSNCTFSGNLANEVGGAIYNLGTLDVSSSTFLGNRTDNWGGAIGIGNGVASIISAIAPSRVTPRRVVAARSSTTAPSPSSTTPSPGTARVVWVAAPFTTRVR